LWVLGFKTGALRYLLLPFFSKKHLEFFPIEGNIRLQAGENALLGFSKSFVLLSPKNRDMAFGHVHCKLNRTEFLSHSK
jgi:hypothetical protein